MYQSSDVIHATKNVKTKKETNDRNAAMEITMSFAKSL
jgi:hypothetical protein